MNPPVDLRKWFLKNGSKTVAEKQKGITYKPVTR